MVSFHIGSWCKTKLQFVCLWGTSVAAVQHTIETASDVGKYCDDYEPANVGKNFSVDHRFGEGQRFEYGERATDSEITPFFVKFHKVGGTTIMDLLHHRHSRTGISELCDCSCGARGCEDEELVGCTGHYSMGFIRRMLRSPEAPKPINPDDLLDSRNLASDKDRLKFVQSFNFKWFTAEQIKFVILLRQPVEKIRSLYYFRRASDFCHGPTCIEKKMNFINYLHQKKGNPDDASSEYVQVLGVASRHLDVDPVRAAQIALSTLFDVVGTTELMSETIAEISRVFGIPLKIIKDDQCDGLHRRDNSDNKLDWQPGEKEIAERVVEDDTKIWEFAMSLQKARMGKH